MYYLEHTERTYPNCPDNVFSASPEIVKGSSDLGDLKAVKQEFKQIFSKSSSIDEKVALILLSETISRHTKLLLKKQYTVHCKS